MKNIIKLILVLLLSSCMQNVEFEDCSDCWVVENIIENIVYTKNLCKKDYKNIPLNELEVKPVIGELICY